jgi:hypothetical protein
MRPLAAVREAAPCEQAQDTLQHESSVWPAVGLWAFRQWNSNDDTSQNHRTAKVAGKIDPQVRQSRLYLGQSLAGEPKVRRGKNGSLYRCYCYTRLLLPSLITVAPVLSSMAVSLGRGAAFLALQLAFLVFMYSLFETKYPIWSQPTHTACSVPPPVTACPTTPIATLPPASSSTERETCDYPENKGMEEQQRYAEAVCHRAFGYECPFVSRSDLDNVAVRTAMSQLYDGFLDMKEPAQLQRWYQLSNFLAERLPLGNMGENNGMYGVMDGFILYAMLRLHRTAQILEIGAGESTFQASLALDMNARDGVLTRPRKHVCVEPYRSQAIQGLVDSGKVSVHLSTVQKMPMDLADDLQAGDMLFIDSSHVLAPLGDTLFEILFLLPRLNPGVIVHIHDIFLPWNYHSSWIKQRPYTEQWVLAAYLHKNPDWEILFATTMMMNKYRDIVAKDVPFGGGNFFIQKTANAAPLRSFGPPAPAAYI